MDRKGIKKHKKIFEEGLNGKIVQYYVNSNNTWSDIDAPAFYYNCKYRIKPEVYNFKFGETILVSDDQIDWKERIFINSDDNKVYTFSKSSFNTLITMPERNIIRKFAWKYAKRIENKRKIVNDDKSVNNNETVFDPKPGDHILVRDSLDHKWHERIFVGFNKSNDKCVCIVGDDKQIIYPDFNNNVATVSWNFAKPLIDENHQD